MVHGNKQPDSNIYILYTCYVLFGIWGDDMKLKYFLLGILFTLIAFTIYVSLNQSMQSLAQDIQYQEIRPAMIIPVKMNMSSQNYKLDVYRMEEK